MKLVTIFVSAILIIKIANSQTCNFTPDKCWASCFENDNGNITGKFKKLAMLAHDQRTNLKTRGTSISLDTSSGDPNIVKYQKNIAALLSLVLDVSTDCNSFCPNLFNGEYGLYDKKWSCKNKCQAHNFWKKMNPKFEPRNHDLSLILGAVALSQHCLEGEHNRCSSNNRYI